MLSDSISEGVIFQNFLGGHAPDTPRFGMSLHAYTGCVHTYIHMYTVSLHTVYCVFAHSIHAFYNSAKQRCI